MRELRQGEASVISPDPGFESVCIHGLYPDWCAVCNLEGKDRKWLGRTTGGSRSGPPMHRDSRPMVQKVCIK